MAMNENGMGSPSMPAFQHRPRGLVLNPLHEAAMRLAGLGINRSREKTRDLVTLLLSHGARAWRQSQPQAHIHLYIGAQGGHTPVRVRLR